MGKPFPPLTITTIKPVEQRSLLSFYPNPATEEIQIETKGQTGEAIISDLSGKQLNRFS